MTRELARGSRASLLRTPQRLGILPTWWFWNDPERQNLLLPLTLVTGVPLGLLLYFLTLKVGLGGWLITFSISTFIYSTMLMGLVERHIRRQLRRRIAAGAIDVPGAAAAEQDEPRAAEDSHRVMLPRASGGGAPRLTSRRVSLACLIFSILALALFAESLVLAVIGVSGLLLWLVIPPVRGMLGRLDQAGQPSALREGEKRDWHSR